MKPRLGFLGLGWIGRHRMECIEKSGVAEVAAIVDPALPSGPKLLPSFAALLESDLDGVVIATPSAQHAEQSIAALRRGLAVFCQKPLGRNAREVKAVLDAARAADRLLGVDLSYRHTEAAAKMRERLPDCGEIYAVNLVFHNAYGPDKPWFYDPALAGGGCVMDLGIHLVDLCLWMLDFPRIERVDSALHGGGCEDYAAALIRLGSGASVQLACSWKLPAGQDCVIQAEFYGTRGAVALRNLNGSFYDFEATFMRGTSREIIAAPPDAWGGRAAVAWATQLASSKRFDEAAGHLAMTAEALDRIYEAR